MKVFRKSDEDHLDYFLDLSSWMPAGDEISSVEVHTNEEAALEYKGHNFSEDSVKIWVAGGKSGEQYNIKVLVHTDAGRTKEINFMIVVTKQ